MSNINTKSDEVVKATDVEDKIPPKEQKGARFAKRGRRGKISQKQHQDAFRQKVGSDVVRKEREAIEKRKFAEIDDTINQLTNLYIHSTPITIQLPITTRALGLTVEVAWIELLRVFKNRPLPATKNEFYRAVLAVSSPADEGLVRKERHHVLRAN